MAVYVNTNYSALQGQRYLGNVQNSLTTTYQRLSSGMRINSAKDDAAGLQIADRLTSQINGLNQGNRNASDGIALAQTIESGIDEISGMLQKIRTLAVQASNGTNTAEDRTSLAKEATALVNEISRIAKQTTYGGASVLRGTTKGAIYNTVAAGNAAVKASNGGKMTLQVGSNKGDTISFDVASFVFSHLVKAAKANTKAFASIKGDDQAVKFSAVSTAQVMIEAMDTLIASVDAQRANLGAIQNHESLRKQPLKSLKVA